MLCSNSTLGLVQWNLPELRSASMFDNHPYFQLEPAPVLSGFLLVFVEPVLALSPHRL